MSGEIPALACAPSWARNATSTLIIQILKNQIIPPQLGTVLIAFLLMLLELPTVTSGLSGTCMLWWRQISSPSCTGTSGIDYSCWLTRLLHDISCLTWKGKAWMYDWWMYCLHGIRMITIVGILVHSTGCCSKLRVLAVNFPISFTERPNIEVQKCVIFNTSPNVN